MRAKFFYLLFTAFFVSGCASGAKISELNIPINDGEKTQIIVFRDNIFGTAIQPNITVNNKVTGTCKPNGAFIVNVEEGEHKISTRTENTAVLTTTVKRGETKFIKCEIGLGFFLGRVYLKEILQSNGHSIVNNLVLTGEY